MTAYRYAAERHQPFICCRSHAVDSDREARATADAEVARLTAERDALRAALTEAISEAYCPTTAGGTEGKWCLNHDTPMVNEDRCAMVEGWMAALATPAAEGEWCDKCDHPGHLDRVCGEPFVSIMGKVRACQW